jgi:glycosyltransferase involved in cell wall biosynthesis
MNKTNPKISIIVPVYNCEKFIGQCIRSILTQSFADFELICVNDGSTDSTLHILDRFAITDDRMMIINQDNKGEGAARNTGLDKARGEYLAFFDADDFLDSKLLEKSIQAAESNNADIVIYKVDSYNEETGETLPIPWSLDIHGFPEGVISYKDNPDFLFFAFQNWTWNKLFKSEFIKDAGLRFHEIQRSADLFFVCCALAKAKRIIPLPEVLYHYRTGNPESNISTNDRAPLDFYYSFVKVKEYLIEENLYNDLKRGLNNWATGSIFFNFSTLKSQKSFEEMRAFLQSEGCKELGIDELEEYDFFMPLYYEQLQHLLNDSAEEFLFSQYRCANRKSEENLNERLRFEKSLDNIHSNAVYRAGSKVRSAVRKLTSSS